MHECKISFPSHKLFEWTVLPSIRFGSGVAVCPFGASEASEDTFRSGERSETRKKHMLVTGEAKRDRRMQHVQDAYIGLSQETDGTTLPSLNRAAHYRDNQTPSENE